MGTIPSSTTLITGAGLVGTATAVRLVEELGHRVILLDIRSVDGSEDHTIPTLEGLVSLEGDVRDTEFVAEVLRAYDVDRVIHTAGLLARGVRNDPVQGTSTNVGGTCSVLEAARRGSIRRVVVAGSTTVAYGLGRTGPSSERIQENVCLDVEEQYPLSLYACSKLAAEWLANLYREHHELETVTVRLSGVFGPSVRESGGGAQVLIGKLVESALNGAPVTLGRSRAHRSLNYIYVQDAAQALLRALTARDLAKHVFHVGQSENFSAFKLVSLLDELSPGQVDFHVEEDASGGPRPDSPLLDTSRARDHLGWREEFPMNDALADYVKWTADRLGIPT